MTTAIRPASVVAPSRSVLRGIGAVVAGLLANVVLSGAADHVLHWLGVFPPWGQITYEPIPYALAVTYRAIFGVLGGYISARLAPWAPMRHALALGVVGILFGIGGLVAAIVANLGPVWYPAVLVLIALPASRIGGRFYIRRSS